MARRIVSEVTPDEHRHTEPTDKQLSEAIQWLMRTEETMGGDPLVQAQLEEWLASSPQHQIAWQRLAHVNQQFSATNLQITAKNDVSARVAMHSIQKSDAHIASKRRSLKVIFSLAGLGILDAATLDSMGLYKASHYAYDFVNADLRTSVGEQSHHQLADGSKLILNTETAVDVDLAAQAQLYLHYGEMALTTAANKTVALQANNNVFVAAENSDVTLYKDNDFCQLQVISGAVNCFINGETKQVRAGNRLEINNDRFVTLAIDQSAVSWRYGVLIAEQHTLGDFIHQLARYRVGHLSCADEIKNLTLSGSFPINNTELILENVCQTLAIKQHRMSRYYVKLTAV
ncbi:hypothetical protein A9Q78_00735 [Methylophaga sp. 41_12_T18]|nr:hypothetical protein A9Q78_00735 [Methylophaga sp. 41_12_T18]